MCSFEPYTQRPMEDILSSIRMNAVVIKNTFLYELEMCSDLS